MALAYTFPTRNGGAAIAPAVPSLAAPLTPVPVLVPPPDYAPAELRPFLPYSPPVYGGPAIVAPVTNTRPDAAAPGAPANPATRPVVLVPPSAPVAHPVTVAPPVVLPEAARTLLERLKAAPWWALAAGLVLASALVSPKPIAAAG